MASDLLRRCVIGTFYISLSACSVGPEYHRPNVSLPESFQAEGIDWHRVDGALDNKEDDSAWWRDLQDGVLDDLIKQAWQANSQLAQAAAAYRQAQAGVRSARAQYWPVVGLGIDGSRGRSPQSQLVGQNAEGAQGGSPLGGVAQTVTSEVSLSWQPDFWGKQRRTVESENAGAQAQAAELAAAKLSIASNVVNDYIGLRQTDNDFALLERERDAYAQLLDIAVRSRSPGSTSEDDVLNARNGLASAEVTLANVRIARAQYEHALAALCGKTASDFHIAEQPKYSFGEVQVPATLPAQMLRRRPDINAAERQVAAANAQIGVSEAAFFPDITLNAQDGYSGSSLSHLLSAPSRLWSLGPQLAETLFDGGARKAGMAEARAGYDGAVAAYRQSVVIAIQQVEDGLSSLHSLRTQRAFQAQVDLRQQALFAHLERQQVIGTASRRDVLGGALLAAQASRAANDVAAQTTMASANLVVALGGSASDPLIVAFSPESTR